jgi:hypothetical protein
MTVEECSLILSLQELRDALEMYSVFGDGFVVGAVFARGCKAGSFGSPRSSSSLVKWLGRPDDVGWEKVSRFVDCAGAVNFHYSL